MNLATSPELRTDRSILRPYSLVIGLSASQKPTSGDLRAGLVNTTALLRSNRARDRRSSSFRFRGYTGVGEIFCRQNFRSLAFD